MTTRMAPLHPDLTRPFDLVSSAASPSNYKPNIYPEKRQCCVVAINSPVSMETEQRLPAYEREGKHSQLFKEPLLKSIPSPISMQGPWANRETSLLCAIVTSLRSLKEKFAVSSLFSSICQTDGFLGSVGPLVSKAGQARLLGADSRQSSAHAAKSPHSAARLPAPRPCHLLRHGEVWDRPLVRHLFI